MKSLEVLAWVAGLLGFGLLVAGVAMLSVPFAFIVAGIGLLLWAYLADKAAAAPAPTHEGGG